MHEQFWLKKSQKYILNNILLQDSIVYSFCSTTDIDYFCHMNNGKYFRDLDFGR